MQGYDRKLKKSTLESGWIHAAAKNVASFLGSELLTHCRFPDSSLLPLYTIVIIRNWLGNLANFKGTNKDQKIYVGRSTILHNLLFCAHTLWLNYVTITFLLVSSLGAGWRSRAGLWPKKQKTNKNIEHRIFPNFLTIREPLLKCLYGLHIVLESA